MELKKNVKLKISGQPKEDGSIEKLRRRVHQQMVKVDPNIQVSETSFARIRYTLIWSGENADLDKIDSAYTAAVKSAEENLLEWIFNIHVNYIESEKTG